MSGRVASPDAVPVGASGPLVRVEHVDRGIVHLVLDRPKARNALSPLLIGQLRAALATLTTDAHVRAVVLRGDGLDFCAGADLDWMRQISAMAPEQIALDSQPLQKLYLELDTLRFPVIGIAHGNTMAGGLGLLAACDVVIADGAAKFGVTEVKLGLIPALLAPFLMRKIGASMLRYLAVTGRVVDAHFMSRAGLVHFVGSDESEVNRELIRLIESLHRASPQAIGMCKAMLRGVASTSLDEALPSALDWVAQSRRAECAREGIDAFLNRCAPPWLPA